MHSSPPPPLLLLRSLSANDQAHPPRRLPVRALPVPNHDPTFTALHRDLALFPSSMAHIAPDHLIAHTALFPHELRGEPLDVRGGTMLKRRIVSKIASDLKRSDVGGVERCVRVGDRFELRREDGQKLWAMQWGDDMDRAMEGVGSM